jgi:hypothetical protein
MGNLPSLCEEKYKCFLLIDLLVSTPLVNQTEADSAPSHSAQNVSNKVIGEHKRKNLSDIDQIH